MLTFNLQLGLLHCMVQCSAIVNLISEWKFSIDKRSYSQSPQICFLGLCCFVLAKHSYNFAFFARSSYSFILDIKMLVSRVFRCSNRGSNTVVAILSPASHLTRLLSRSLSRPLSLTRYSNGDSSGASSEKTVRGVLGIRREESNVWERRAPLSPNHVQSLVSKGAEVSYYNYEAIAVCSVLVLCLISILVGRGFPSHQTPHD